MTTQPNTLEQPVVREQIKAAIIDGQSDSAIARVHGVTRQAIHLFRKRHAAEIAPIVAAIEKSIEDYAIATRIKRIAAMNDRWERGIALIEARATDSRYVNEPGYSTGIMVHKLKSIGSGEFSETVDEYAFDSALYASLLALENAASDQMGQTPKQAEAIRVNVDNRVQQVFVRQVVGAHKELG